MRKAAAVIGSGLALSGNVHLGQERVIGIMMPTTMTGWTTAVLTFQGSNDGGQTYQEMFDSAGAAISITAAPGEIITFTQDLASRFDCMNDIKVRSGTSGSPVTQTPAQTIDLLVRDPSQF